MATSACEDQPIPTIGLDLGEMFPERSDWYWKYNHDEFSEVSYWHNRGLTTPAGAEWITYRFWVADEQGIIEDIADGDPSSWDLEIFWEEQSNGWYLRGWSANPEGPSAHLGTQIFEEGVPFALSNVPASGATWTASAGGVDWVTTAFREMTELQFNGQVINDAWRIEVATDDGESVLDSVWWLVNGPGFVQWALPDFRDEDSVRAWQHVHNDSYDNILGSR
ncbi:MAG: hypothetical protein VX498_00740 [Myxococcota bacterium]|nr:hypothetical protein [Myxococcota bacterium]